MLLMPCGLRGGHFTLLSPQGVRISDFGVRGFTTEAQRFEVGGRAGCGERDFYRGCTPMNADGDGGRDGESGTQLSVERRA